jgi:signal transduction histidine kinase
MTGSHNGKDTTVEQSIGLPFHKRRQLERDLEHISQEMYKRNRELAETNKTLSLLRTIDALVLESHTSLKQVCEQISQAITQLTDYSFAGLFTRPTHQEGHLTLYGWSDKHLPADQTGLLNKPLHLKLSDPWFESPAASQVVALDTMPAAAVAQYLNCKPHEVEKFRQQLSIQTLYVVKLKVRRRLVGLLVVGFARAARQITPTETLQIDRLSETIGVALDNKLLFEENQRVLRQIKESNNKLRALDEAKDDFISMASHQLRTPLTSVKGYLSMVLDGDTGKINPTQQQMLKQAFFSSQRMVYLIADLLNVSRLRTGKFTIETIPVNLAHVVSEEVEQLQETAQSRELKLTYETPKDFPELLFDETKTRQVIMNFIDNAIYYTPAGGHIEVKLLNKDQTIELQVKDNGMGVPKHEQAHLFTKFYRAGNARQARPDGTGLGLYMAKKVVIAQGGSLIFDSHEGKGSTFGFIFSKHKLTPPKN